MHSNCQLRIRIHQIVTLVIAGIFLSALSSCDPAISGTVLDSSTSPPPNFTPNPSDPTDPWSAQPGWTLKWQDEFNGTSIDSANWDYNVGTGENGWGNHELEYYRLDNATIGQLGGNSCLIITAKKESIGGMDYTSSRLLTKGKRSWTYGRIEARMQLPRGQGIWPAFWMLGNSIDSNTWPKCGEIDIMEMIGGTQNSKDNTTYGTIHFWDDSLAEPKGNHLGGSKTLANPLGDGFHVFGIEWRADHIYWYLDGQYYYGQSLSPSYLSELKMPFFILFNLAVGGDWPGSPDSSTVFPQQLAVDWVRVYQQ